MNAKNPNVPYDDNCVVTARRPVRHAPVSRAWVSEAIGFDSRSPEVPAKSGAGGEQFRYERVSVDEVRTALSGAAATVGPKDPVRLRRQTPPEPLQDSTARWLAQLPASLLPLELARLFPRIANKVCSLWSDRTLCDRYLSSLLVNTREYPRQGFPLAVAAEIAALLGRVESSQKEQPWGQAEGAWEWSVDTGGTAGGVYKYASPKPVSSETSR